MDLDGKGLVTGWTSTISPGIPYVASSSADQQVRTGYATLSCTDYVRALVLYTSYTTGGTGSNLGAVFGSSDSSCSASNLAFADPVDQQGGSQLAFAIANNTTRAQTYWVSFNVRDNSLPQWTTETKVTVPAHTSIAQFLTEILPASANSVGSITIGLNGSTFRDPGFSVMALRYTGAAFRTIPVACVPIC